MPRIEESQGRTRLGCADACTKLSSVRAALDCSTRLPIIQPVMLSAQTTDAAVNRSRPSCSVVGPDAPSMAAAMLSRSESHPDHRLLARKG